MEHVGRLLKRIHTIMEQNFNNMLNQYDLTAAQLDVLIVLLSSQDAPMCQKQIEDRLMLKNPTVTGMLNRLETKGFITRTPLDTDRRYNQIARTERARELGAALLNSARANDERMLAGFDAAELGRLGDYLNRILDNHTDRGGCE